MQPPQTLQMALEKHDIIRATSLAPGRCRSREDVGTQTLHEAEQSHRRDHGILDESVTSLHGETRSETFASSVSVESSDGFEPPTTDESDYSEDDDGLMQSLHLTKPGQLCYLSFDLFSLTMG